MAVMNKSERLKAAIAGEPVDRVPVALWRHFPVDDTDPETLADSAVSYQREFDFDLIKVTPASSFSVRDWGVEDAWKGNPEGTKDYVRVVVVEPRDWTKLEPRDPIQGELGAQLRCLEIARRQAAPDVPVLPTVFSPLTQAKHLAGEKLLLEHLRRAPAEVEAGLRTITRSTIAWVEEARKRGIAGLFYAVQHATYGILDREAYRRFGEADDRQILEAAGGLWLNVLHLHGEALMFDLAETYPVQVVNWHDRQTEPGLVEGKRRVAGAVCGGLSRWETLVLGTPQVVEAEAQDAIRALGGRGLILGAGCVVPVVAPRANLKAARRVVECA
jgi:uroporphyrinogen decarboxylase